MSPRARAFLAALAALATCAAVLAWTRSARAEREIIVPFHEGGHVVLDQLSGLRIQPNSGFAYAGPIGFASRTDKADAVSPAAPGTETTTTSLWLAPSADVFVTDHLSVGGLIEIRHSWGAIESGATRLELPGTTSMTFLPRVGFYVPVSDRIGVWPRLGVGWSSAESVSFVSTGSALGRETLRSMVLDADLSFVYRFGETLFMRAGPEVGVTLGGRRSTENAGTTTGAGASVLQISGVIGFGMNLEL